MRPFKPPPHPAARAASPRALLTFRPGTDDPARAIFDRVLVHVRARVPSLAHHPLHELDVLFGDLANEIAEIVDASGATAQGPSAQCPDTGGTDGFR